METTTWLTFFAASWAISISPGPGAIASMSAGLNHGFAYGYVTIFGLVLGIWTQLLIVGVGLGALMATSATAFVVVKWLGVAYLVWLGIQQWRAPARPMVAVSDSRQLVTQRALIAKAWMVNVVNPKGTVFLLAVVPQFISPAEPLLAQYLIIGATLAFTDMVVMAGYTAMASRVLGALKEPAHIRAINRIFGGLFVLAGSLLALFKRSI
jgi:homoserine/homoserine lactone efflux protein